MLVIPISVANAILTYLIRQPWNEVNELIVAIQKLQKFDDVVKDHASLVDKDLTPISSGEPVEDKTSNNTKSK